MGLASDRLLDWGTARSVGARAAGQGPVLTGVDRARLLEDFADGVPLASGEVERYTGLSVGGYPARPWVMGRSEWIGANLRTFNGLLEPLAERILARSREGALATVRRATLGAQVGGLLGYLSRKVLGQFDAFLPPDDDGLIYFVGPNVVGVERRFGFRERDFRLWVALHEATHRVQFGAVPWLRGYVNDLASSYLGSVDLDPRRMIERVKHATQAVRTGDADWRGLGWIVLLMTPDQRETFGRVQAVMTLLEGHAMHVMDAGARRAALRAATRRTTAGESAARAHDPAIDRLRHEGAPVRRGRTVRLRDRPALGHGGVQPRVGVAVEPADAG
jgi:coenzyme F420 biosynthesis associated uncharacterized protein